MNKEIKINKKLARNMYNAGYKVELLPCKVRYCNLWIMPCKMESGVLSFDEHVKYFEYYNCSYELGYYASYYVSVDDYKSYKWVK